MARSTGTSGKKSQSPAKRRSKKRDKHVNYEVICLVIIAAAILIGLSFFTTAIDPLGAFVKNLFLGLFGAPGYLLCFILLGCGIHFIIKRDITAYKSKYVMMTILVAFISAFWNVAVKSTAGNYWTLGTQGVGGGIIGGLCFKAPLLSVQLSGQSYNIGYINRHTCNFNI